MSKCKDCKHFNRARWHKSIDPTESEQHGGSCKKLKDVLGMSNSFMWMKKSLHVYESFGCVLFLEEIND